MKRTRNIQNFLDRMKKDFGISDSFAAASDHPYTCRCNNCLSWWLQMGPEDDDDPTYGPFTVEEIAEARRECEQDGPHPGDLAWIGDDDDDNPVYVEVEADVSNLFMGYVDGQPVTAG